MVPAVAVTPAVAQSARPPRDDLSIIRARGELRVCMWPDYFAISYRNPRNGDLEGIDIDMARALAQRLNVPLRFIETNFATFMDRLEAGDCEIAMMAVGITEPRAARIAFSKPYMASSIYGVTTRDNTRINRWEDIDTAGTVVAVASGTVMEPVMRAHLRRAELLVVYPPATREAELQAGRADVFMSDFPYTRRMVLMHDWARVIEPPGRFADTLYAYAVAKADPAWLAEVNAFLVEMRADGALARIAQRHGLGPVMLP